MFSSRSHLLIVLTVEGRDLTTQVRTKGTLTLVDLAGSERVAKSEVSGQQLVEAVAINRSLSALGQVSEQPAACCVNQMYSGIIILLTFLYFLYFKPTNKVIICY